MIRRLVPALGLGAVLGVLGLTGVASANTPKVTATCDGGLVFDMPAGEAGTAVSVWLDDVPTFGPVVVAAQGDPVRFTLPAPAARTVAHTWRVLIDSRWNADQTVVRDVAPCPSPTTSTSTTTTSTTSTIPATTVPSTVPATTGSTVLITTPRPAPTTTTVTATTLPGFLPATGPELGTVYAAAIGLVAGFIGGLLLVVRHHVRGGRR